MKLTKLSNEFLEYMVKAYHDTHNKGFGFAQFKELHPDFDDEFISDALYLLQKDGFVSVFPADNIAYMVSLDVSAVRNAEENTLLKKGYDFAKEIKSWI